MKRRELKLAVCPHETKRWFQYWEHFAQRLQEKTGLQVKLIIFSDFEEERERIKKEKFDLYYASSEIVLTLSEKGYIPLAKFKKTRDVIVLIGKKFPIDKKPIKIALPFHKLFLLVFLKLKLHKKDVLLHFTNLCKEAVELVEKGEADLGIVYKDNFYISEGMKIFEEYSVDSYHLFMCDPEVKELLKPVIFEFEELEEATIEDLEFFKKLFKDFEDFIENWQNADIAKAVFNAPNVGVVIYQEKVVYANEYICKLLGYSPEEIKNYQIEELVGEEFQEEIRKIRERRLRGERFVVVRKYLRFKRKDGSTGWVLLFADTIFYQGRPAGFVIAIDVTRKKRLEALYSVLKQIHEVLITCLEEKEVCQKLSELLIDKLNLKAIWIGIFEENTKTLIPFYTKGLKNYLPFLKIVIEKEEMLNPIAVAFKTNKIFIIPDIKKLPESIYWREEIARHGIRSVSIIPVEKQKKVSFVIALFSENPRFFEEENLEILKKIKENIEFAFERIEDIKRNTIIAEAIKNLTELFIIIDENCKIIYVNDAVTKITGYSAEELIGKNCSILRPEPEDRIFQEKIRECFIFDKTYTLTISYQRKDGKIFYLYQTMFPVKLPGGVKRLVILGTDITKEIRLFEELEKSKLYDSLTNILNLQGFIYKITETLEKSLGPSLFIMIDIYNFSFINRNYGFTAGNQILKEIALRLVRNFRQCDIIGRLGGDEFGIFVPNLKDEKEGLVAITKKIHRVFEKPFVVEGEELTININMGIAIYPKDGKIFKSLYERASLALAAAKKEGAGETRIFNEEIEKEIENLLKIEKLVDKALKKNLFTFYYQPYFRTKDLKLVGFEALVRIIDEDGTIYTPAVFIDFLENSKYLVDFEDWALQKVEEQIKKWKIPISFNVSARSFRRDDFIKKLEEVCKKCKKLFVIEITERVFINNMERAVKILENLKEYSNIAIDDFGTGYSSFNYLKELPVSILKLDISFTKRLLEDGKDRLIVKSIVKLARSLKIKTLAEGIEKEQQMEILRKFKCDFLQGYLLAKPMPAHEIEKQFLLTKKS